MIVLTLTLSCSMDSMSIGVHDIFHEMASFHSLYHPKTACFRSLSSWILRTWPKKFNFLSIILCMILKPVPVLFMISLFLIFYCHFMFNNLLRHFISKAQSRFMLLFFNVHASATYIRTLITYTDSILILVWLLISLLCHTFLNLWMHRLPCQFYVHYLCCNHYPKTPDFPYTQILQHSLYSWPSSSICLSILDDYSCF